MKYFIYIILFISTPLLATDFNTEVLKGDSCFEKHDYNNAISFYKNALSIKPERLLTNSNDVEILSKLAQTYTQSAEYDEALNYLFKYIEKNNVKKNDSLLAYAYNNIGVIYQYIGSLDQSLKYLKKTIEIAGNDSSRIGGAYNNIAGIYQKKGDLKKTQMYYKKALKVFESIGLYKGIVVTTINIGIINLEENNTGLAFEYLSKAKVMAQEKQDTSTYIAISINLGDYFIKVADYNNAEVYLKWALKNSSLQNNRLYESAAYKSLVDLYKTQKDYQKAFEYLEEYKEINDEIFNQNSDREYASLEAKYSLREKEKANEQLKKEQILITKQINNKNKYIWTLSFLVIISILFIILFYLQKIKKAKTQELLELQNREILKSKKQIEDLNRQYEKLIKKYEKRL